MTDNCVLLTKSNHVGIVTLNSPHNLNAFNYESSKRILEVLEECEEDNEIRAVVIQANGPAFCAGGDIKDMVETLEKGEIGKDFFAPILKNLGNVAIRIRKMPKPVIASVHKAAAGAGFNFVLACDFCIAAENAKFIQSFVNIGLVPDMGGIYFLNKYLNVNKTIELAMTGKRITAQEALELGLINEVVPFENLKKRTLEFAEKLACGPTKAYGNMKELIYNVSYADLEEYLVKETEKQIASSRTLDFKEGLSAFLEKRTPQFKGE